jgi:hypothetical protein
MGDIMKDVTSIAMAVIGVAIIAVLVGPNTKTTAVVGAASSGFAQVLGVAMGTSAGTNNSSSNPYGS